MVQLFKVLIDENMADVVMRELVGKGVEVRRVVDLW